MSSPTNWMKKEYEDLVKKGFDWKPPVINGPSTGRTIIDGKERIMLCANNYLSLSNHPKVKQAAIDAVKSHGAGSGSVRPIAGNMDIHNELEDTIARFKNREAALYYQTGFAVNSGLIPQLAGKKDSIISDQLNHGSIIDGVRLSGVKKENRTIYAHNDMGELENRLKEATKKSEKTLVISDGVFSMDGDIAPLDKITKLAREYGAMTYIDDCHGEGVLAGGRGTRLKEYFDGPKPLCPVNNNPFLHYVLQYWASQGASKFIICGGPDWKLFKDHFTDKYMGVPIDYVSEEIRMGTGGAMLKGAELLKSPYPFMVINGDTLFKVRFDTVYAYNSRNCGVIMCLNQEIQNYHYMKVILIQDYKVN